VRSVSLVVSVSALGLVALLVGAPGSPVRAAGDEQVIAAGPRGGTYHHVYAVNLKARLRAFKVGMRTTQGSVENLDLLADGRAELGFVQADVYRARLRREPGRYAGIGVVGPLADECLFVAHRKEGPVVDAAGLKGRGERAPRLAVGQREGGTHATWQIVRELEPAYDAAEVGFTADTLAINHLSAGGLDAVAWMTDPDNADHKLLQATLADDSLDLFGIADPALLAEGTGYTRRELSVPGHGFAKLATICTPALILARPEAPPRLVRAVSDLLSLEREKLLGRD